MICTILGVLSVAVAGYANGQDSFVGAVATAVFADRAGDWMRSICRFGDEAYLRRYRGIHENHVIVRTLREAQLQALEDLLRRFNADRRGHRDTAQENFAGLLADFIRHEKGLVRRFRFDGAPEAADAERQLRLDVVSKLPEAAGLVLSARHGPARAAGDRDRFRRACEAAVLGELRVLVCAEIPPLFLSAFEGDPNRADGWFDLFFRAVAVALKKSSEFDRLWQAEQSAAILYLGRETAERAKEIAQEVRDRAIEQGEALGALAGDVEAVRAYREAIHDRVAGNRAMPPDFPPRWTRAGISASCRATH